MTTRYLRSILSHGLLVGSLAAGAALVLPACGSDDAGADGNGADGGLSDGSGDGFGDALIPLDVLQQETGNDDGSVSEGGCGGEAVLAEPVLVNLLVVIDRSGSMNQTPAGFTQNKWDTLVGALNSSLTAIQDKMSIGLQFFPDPDAATADGCGMSAGDSVAIQIGKGTVTVPIIEATLDDPNSAPSGNTPTAAALALAHRYFTTGPGAQLEGEKHVLLALDGGPNCNPAQSCQASTCTVNVDRSSSDPSASACPIDPASCCGDGSDTELNKSCLDATGTIQQVAALQGDGVTTFVIGIPGSDLYTDVLDGLAVAGGEEASATSPKYFEVTNPQQLTDTLVSITTNLIKTCVFQLDHAPPASDKVNVFIDGVVVPKDGPDGWEYDGSTNPPTITIKGATCDELKSEGAQSVTFEFGCPTIT